MPCPPQELRGDHRSRSLPHHRPERTCERDGCAPREKREESTEATPAYLFGSGHALRSPSPSFKTRVRGKGNEAEVRKSELEPKYGSYGFTPSGIPFVIATSRPVGYSPGGATRKGAGGE